MRPVVVESVGEGVGEGLEFADSLQRLVSCLELIAPSRLGPLDAAVEFWVFGRQHEQLQPPRLACGLEDGIELAPAIDPRKTNGASAISLPRRLFAQSAEALVATVAAVHLAAGP
jgi:hypothetical protein